MPKMINPDDTTFMTGMKTMFGFDEDAVCDLLTKLTLEQMIDLAAAVTNNDKAAAEPIVQTGSVDEDGSSSDDAPNTDDDSTEQEADDNDHMWQTGDAVQVDGEDATVSIDHAPGNTIGVMIGGKLKMVDKSEITKIEEGVLGMTMMPGLTRMRELAGIAGPTLPAALPQPEASVCPTAIKTEGCDEENPSAICLSALDHLEQALPNVKLVDLKVVRQRISDITCKMNESFDRAGKRIVAEALKSKRR